MKGEFRRGVVSAPCLEGIYVGVVRELPSIGMFRRGVVSAPSSEILDFRYWI